ncbi:hypothetical protein [Bradyrhizobium sp. 153]|uniref:hypothetical protein n=1 Tax=Bradyrhizobium sp. 153 TaxID=2782627 RepID=UPI001FF91BFE|nr:hypothetical protein [Bradyrhizobium sp. 153]MCK1668616.1 hypothetical protein [Bradyrhizobium sp. 153]
MAQTIYKGTKDDPGRLDLWQNVKLVNWGDGTYILISATVTTSFLVSPSDSSYALVSDAHANCSLLDLSEGFDVTLSIKGGIDVTGDVPNFTAGGEPYTLTKTDVKDHVSLTNYRQGVPPFTPLAPPGLGYVQRVTPVGPSFSVSASVNAEHKVGAGVESFSAAGVTVALVKLENFKTGASVGGSGVAIKTVLASGGVSADGLNGPSSASGIITFDATTQEITVT